METQRLSIPRPRSIHEDLDDLITRLGSNDEVVAAELDDNSKLEQFTALLHQARELTLPKSSKLTRRHSIGSSLPLRENKWKKKYAQGVNLSSLDEGLSTTKESSGTSLKVEEESKENPNKVDLVSPESETQLHSIPPSSPSSSYSVSPYSCESFHPDKSELVISVMPPRMSRTVSGECLVVAQSLIVPQSALAELSSAGL